MYQLSAGNTGYKVELTKKQVEHMLYLWGSNYSIDDIDKAPLYSPSGYTKIEYVESLVTN